MYETLGDVFNLQHRVTGLKLNKKSIWRFFHMTDLYRINTKLRFLDDAIVRGKKYTLRNTHTLSLQSKQIYLTNKDCFANCSQISSILLQLNENLDERFIRV